MKSRGFLLSTDGPLENVLKIKPPLVVSRGQIAAMLESVDDLLPGLG